MRTPSPSWCRLDLTHLWPTGSSLGDTIDYGPELLLMPFGFHLAMDTLPSGDCKWWLRVRLGCIRLSSSCPFRRLHTFPSPASEAFNPAFGYRAPHPSTGGTSTLLITALLSTHLVPIGDSWLTPLFGYTRWHRL